MSWRDELHMVKDKVLEELEILVKEEMITTGCETSEEKDLVESLKVHYKKRLRAFYNSVIVTFRDNVEYVNLEDINKKKAKKVLYTNKDETLERDNTSMLA